MKLKMCVLLGVMFLLVSCYVSAEEFTLRNGIMFHDTMDDVLSKETFPINKIKDKEPYWIETEKVTLAGIPDSVVSYNFNNDKLLVDVNYHFCSSNEKDLINKDYETINNELVGIFGYPLGYTNDKHFIVTGSTLKDIQKIIELYQSTGKYAGMINYDEWDILLNGYHVKIDHIEYYYGAYNVPIKYAHQLNYTYFSNDDLANALSEINKQNDTAAMTVGKHMSYRNVGSYVTFGNYEQDTNPYNEKEPIEWLVLDYDEVNNRALLISRYGLDAKPYDPRLSDRTWENCTLRGWLNGKFFSSAFSPAEQAAILTTEVDNSHSQGYTKWSTVGGNNTQDKVFLLSYAEAHQYFAIGTRSDYQDSSGKNDIKNVKSRIGPTAYAIKNGAYANSEYQTSEGISAGMWWLRSPGYYQDEAANVGEDGFLYTGPVFAEMTCVRPSLWLNLEPDF